MPTTTEKMSMGISSGSIRCAGFVLALTLALPAFSPALAHAADKVDLPDSVLAVVNGDSICTSEFERLFIDFHRGQSSGQKETYNYRKLLNKLVNDKLLVQEALAMGLDSDRDMLRKLNQQKMKNAIKLYYIENFKPDLEIPRETLYGYFKENYHKIRLRTISLIDSSAAARALGDLESGHDMDSLAREVSLDMYKYKGGLQNLKYYADIEVELRDRAEKLTPGSIDGPIPFRGGFTIIKLEERVDADTADLEKLGDKIESILRQEAVTVASREFMDSLYSVYPIEEVADVLNGIAADSSRIFSVNFGSGTGEIALFQGDKYAKTDIDIRNTIARLAMTSVNSRSIELITNGVKRAREDLVLEAAALSDGYLENPKVMDEYRHSLDSALIEQYLQETVLPEIVFNGEEFQAYYDRHKEEFREPREYKLDEVIIDDEATAGQVEGELAEGADFDYLVKRYKLRLSSGNGEDRWVSMRSYPEVIRANIDSLKIGDATPAYPTGDGWLMLRIRDVRPGRLKSVEEVDLQIREAMFQRKFNEALDKILGTLKQNSTVIYNETAIERYLGERRL